MGCLHSKKISPIERISAIQDESSELADTVSSLPVIEDVLTRSRSYCFRVSSGSMEDPYAKFPPPLNTSSVLNTSSITSIASPRTRTYDTPCNTSIATNSYDQIPPSISSDDDDSEEEIQTKKRRHGSYVDPPRKKEDSPPRLTQSTELQL